MLSAWKRPTCAWALSALVASFASTNGGADEPSQLVPIVPSRRARAVEQRQQERQNPEPAFKEAETAPESIQTPPSSEWKEEPSKEPTGAKLPPVSSAPEPAPLPPMTRPAVATPQHNVEFVPVEEEGKPTAIEPTPISPAQRPAAAPATYYSLARYAQESEIATPVTENVFVVERSQLPEGDPQPPSPVFKEEDLANGFQEHYSDANQHSLFWSEPLHCVYLPNSLLWQPPLANQREPRMYAKFTNMNGKNFIETAIGGELGLVRLQPEGRAFEGIQMDVFAAVFTRFDERRLLTAADYRVGAPLTYAKGPWQTKISYEHTSTHMGDEFSEAYGRRQVPHVRDEIVFGLAHRSWNQLRVYGQTGYSFNTSDNLKNKRERFDCGVEWSKQVFTGWKGQPFAAADFDFRSDQDYNTNFTFQIGWQFMNNTRKSGRLALEYYNGNSPYGQFFRDHNEWFGFDFLYDF